MRPKIELAFLLDGHYRHFNIINRGFVDLMEFFEAAFDEIEERIDCILDRDDVYKIETKFYATFLDTEQCKVDFIHTVPAIVVPISGLRYCELSILGHRIKRDILLQIERFMIPEHGRVIINEMYDFDNLEFIVDQVRS